MSSVPGRPTRHCSWVATGNASPKARCNRGSGAPRQAGPDAPPVPGALIHGLCHTPPTELDNAEVNVYTVMTQLGHEPMATSQRYVAAAGADTRDAGRTS
jgi:hypothetical protein